MKTIVSLALLLISQLAHSFEFPTVSDLWLREAPPNARMLAAYVTIQNQQDEAIKLVGAYAPDFGMTEIHKTVEVDGMLRMREQKELPLVAHGEIKMAPGGLHIMLMMPERRFVVGEQARICLVYQDQAGEEHIQHLDFPVKKQ